MQPTLIEMQDEAIARMRTAWGKVGPRTKGFRYQRTVGAAKRDLAARLVRRGYEEPVARQCAQDAYDVWCLEKNATGEDEAD